MACRSAILLLDSFGLVFSYFQGLFFFPPRMRRRFSEYSRNATAKRRNILEKKLTHRLKSGRRAPESILPESTCSRSFSDGLSGNIVIYLVHRTPKMSQRRSTTTVAPSEKALEAARDLLSSARQRNLPSSISCIAFGDSQASKMVELPGFTGSYVSF